MTIVSVLSDPFGSVPQVQAKGSSQRRGAGSIAGVAGCRGYQTARVMKDSERDTVGSHSAGAETYKPLVPAILHRTSPKIDPSDFTAPQTRLGLNPTLTTALSVV